MDATAGGGGGRIEAWRASRQGGRSDGRVATIRQPATTISDGLYPWIVGCQAMTARLGGLFSAGFARLLRLDAQFAEPGG